MVKIEVSGEVLPSKGEKRPRKQVCYVYLLTREGQPQPHPTKFYLPIWSDGQPYAPGNYTLAPASVYVDQYGGLALAPKLVPVAAGRGGA